MKHPKAIVIATAAYYEVWELCSDIRGSTCVVYHNKFSTHKSKSDAEKAARFLNAEELGKEPSNG